MEKLKKYIKYQHISYLTKAFGNCDNFVEANVILKNLTGINEFFDSQNSYLFFRNFLEKRISYVSDVERREYGDFQTPGKLTDSICSFLVKENFCPQNIIEPTFGKGSFILSSIKYFNSIKYVFAVEIYEKYVWETKFKILEYFLDNPDVSKPQIFLFKQNIFEFDLNLISGKISGSVLVLGNPPWITNSGLSLLNSDNLPKKSNLKRHNGLDAITGKGNFDIGESISLVMLKNFSSFDGGMAFLIKNSVIKNLVHDLHKFKFKISNIRTYKIDVKKYFNVSVGASLFTCKFNQLNKHIFCEVYSSLNKRFPETKFGWYKGKFVSDLEMYENNSEYDGQSPYEWRQGVKHDGSKIFELTKNNNKYINGFGEEIDVENDLIYGLIKSSDLKKNLIDKPRKYVIITQHFIGEKTTYIKDKYPKLFNYLSKYEDKINNRKSSIYKNKPKFSIFGIGNYSFKPYKVAISGLYKNPFFSLILPENNKPLMLDDTCYFLSFDELETAIFSWCILSDEEAYNLLKSISFTDSKRPYTKDVLMRLSIDKIARDKDFDDILLKIRTLDISNLENINYQSWERYLNSFQKSKVLSKQVSLF